MYNTRALATKNGDGDTSLSELINIIMCNGRPFMHIIVAHYSYKHTAAN